MQVVSSYGAEIKNKNIPIRHTLALLPGGGPLSDGDI